MEEIRIGLHLEKQIYPVIVGDVRIPSDMTGVHVFRLSDNPSSSELATTAQEIVGVFRSKSPTVATRLSELQKIASRLAGEGPRLGEQLDTLRSKSNSVFVVHGHDDDFVNELELFLKSLDIQPLIMKRINEPDQSLLQRFFTVAGKAQFAVVLLSADDYGVSRRQYELPEVSDKALKFRPRQNVILELGFFFGKLTWDRVIVLFKKPHKEWPDFEMPSDLLGMVTVTIDETDVWKRQVQEKLLTAGFKVRAVG